MYAYRYTWAIKPNCMGKALALCQEWSDRGLFLSEGQIRCYTPSYSPNLFVFEFAIESEELRTKLYAEWSARPETAEFWERWGQLAERGVSHERWTVTEIG